MQERHPSEIAHIRSASRSMYARSIRGPQVATGSSDRGSPRPSSQCCPCRCPDGQRRSRRRRADGRERSMLRIRRVERSWCPTHVARGAPPQSIRRPLRRRRSASSIPAFYRPRRPAGFLQDLADGCLELVLEDGELLFDRHPGTITLPTSITRRAQRSLSGTFRSIVPQGRFPGWRA